MMGLHYNLPGSSGQNPARVRRSTNLRVTITVGPIICLSGSESTVSTLGSGGGKHAGGGGGFLLPGTSGSH